MDMQNELVARIVARWEQEQPASYAEQMLLGVEELEMECRQLAASNHGVFTEHMLAWSTPAGSGYDGRPLTLVVMDGSPPDLYDAWWLDSRGHDHISSVAVHLRTWHRPYNAARQVIERLTGRAVTTAVDTLFGRARS